MAISNTNILIKRSDSTPIPSNGSLKAGELAYSYNSNTAFIGTSDGLGVLEIGGWSDLTNLTAATYGSSTQVPIITVDSHGKVTNVQTQAISTSLQLSSEDGSNTMSLIDGTLKFYGGKGINTSIEANTSNVVFEVDTTVFRSNTALFSQYIDSNVEISGNLHVLGNVTIVDTTTLNVQDPLIYLASNNYYSDIVDIGFVGNYYDADTETQRHAGVMRHAGDKDFYIFYNYDKEPTGNTINVGDASFLVGNTHTNVIGNVTGNVDATLVRSARFLSNESSDTNGGFGFYQDGAQDTGMYSSGDGLIQFKSNGSNNFEIGDGTFTHHTDVTLANGAKLGDTSDGAVFFGLDAGSGGYKSVAVGSGAGQTSQNAFTVAIGLHAGQTSQQTAAVAIGHSAGQHTQGQDSVAVGVAAGINNQGVNATAIGNRAGAGYTTSQGTFAVAVGAFAGYDSQAAHSIAINASGSNLNPTEAGLYIDPIRANNAIGGNVTVYNASTKEVVYTNVKIDTNGITLANGTNITDGESGLFVDSLNFGETNNVVFYNTTTKEVTYGTMADLRGDAIANGTHIWSVDGTTGALYSGAGTYIADSANSIIIGQSVDLTNANTNRVAIGNSAGNISQAEAAVAIGQNAGQTAQSYRAVAIGYNAGYSGQGIKAVAVGKSAGETSQGQDAVALGHKAGQSGQIHGAVAIGYHAGATTQGEYAIAIGYRAGETSQAQNSIVFDALATGLTPSVAGLFINPVRYTAAQDSTYDGLMFYNQSTKEVRYSYALDGGSF
jgi:hypothetical protein